jgi:hypothetical protein
LKKGIRENGGEGVKGWEGEGDGNVRVRSEEKGGEGN